MYNACLVTKSYKKDCTDFWNTLVKIVGIIFK